MNGTPLKTRVLGGFAVLLLLLVGLTSVGVTRVAEIDRALTEMNEVIGQKQRQAINVRGSVHDRAISLRDVALVGDDAAARAAAIAEIERLAAFYAEAAVKLDALMATYGDPEAAALLAELRAIEARTVPAIARTLAATDDAETERLLRTEAAPGFTAWLAAINRFIDLTEARNQAIGAEARAVANGFSALMLGLAALALALGGAFAWWSVRSVAPLGPLARTIDRLAQGDVTAELAATRDRAEVGRISAAVAVFRTNAIEKARLEAAEGAERAAQAARAQAQAEHVQKFQAVLTGLLEGLSRSGAGLLQAANGMSRPATEARTDADGAAAAADRTAGTVMKVASAAEELAATIKEVERQGSVGAETARAAAATAARTPGRKGPSRA